MAFPSNVPQTVYLSLYLCHVVLSVQVGTYETVQKVK